MPLEDNNKKRIKKAIKKTIAFFDMFSYPLTSWEIWKYSIFNNKIEYNEMLDMLKNGADSYIENKNGFFFLRGRESIIKKRLKRFNYSERKFKRALKISNLFRIIPWIKMVSVSNLIGSHNLRNNSDIDFFIITEKNRIWLTRFFTIITIKFLGLRPKENQTKDKICLNFYLSENQLDLSQFMLEGEDIYFVYWFLGITPLYEKRGFYKEFIRKNLWIRKYFFIHTPRDVSESLKVRKDKKNRSIFWEKAEKWAENFQLKLMPAIYKNIMNKDTRVVINEGTIKCHINDRREYYMKKLTDKL